MVTDEGYGTLNGKPAHRLVYEWAYGPIPPSLLVHHKCHTKLCINQAHLEAVTKLEHARRHWRKVVSPRNHRLTSDRLAARLPRMGDCYE